MFQIAEKKICENELCPPIEGVSKGSVTCEPLSVCIVRPLDVVLTSSCFIVYYLTGETKKFKSKFPTRIPLEASDVELEKQERSYQILQHFSKALWTVLKQHGKQLKV